MDDMVEHEDVFSENNEGNIDEIRKNLLDDFETAKTVNKMLKDLSKLSEREPVKVFLRVRPFTSKERALGESQDCLEIENSASVVMHPPKTSFTFKHQARNAVTAETVHRFTFSRVYGPQTTQKDFFEDTSLSLVKDFIDGQNALMFCYGVTNAGKTYTILGTPEHVGILPRTINILFNSFKDQTYNRSNLKPKMFCDVLKLSSIQEEREDSKKRMLLSLIDVSTYHNSVSSCSDLSLQDISNVHTSHEDIMNISALDVISVDVETQGPIQFSVWLSFAEIYNEQIFDLLEPISLGQAGQPRKRNMLKVGDDRKGNPYIKGLTQIHVNNAEEALKLLKIGRKNQKIASTKLNETSSRSHCIFTLKILRVVNKKEAHVARVSRLSFVDLAGSERYTKTQNTGVRLKEAGNINTSLMTLGKCVDLLRYNQNHVNNPRNIPFRESKLTRLLQGFFCGKGKASMVVNVNQCASAFDETLHALKFSAIAKKVTTQVQAPISIPEVPEVPNERQTRMSVPWAVGVSSAVKKTLSTGCNNQEESIAPLAEQEEEEERIVSGPSTKELQSLIAVLQQQLIDEKKKMTFLEVKIREEVSQEMAEQIVEIENNYTERMLENEKNNEDLYEKRMDIVAKSVKRTRKRPRIDHVEDDDDEWVSSVLLHEEKVKGQEMNDRILELEGQLKDKTEEFESAVEKLCQKLSCRDEEILSLKNDVEVGQKDRTTAQSLLTEVEQLRKELCVREEKIKSLEKNLEKDLEMMTESLRSEIEKLRQELSDRDEAIVSLKKDVEAEQKEHTKTELSCEVEKLRKELLNQDELRKELVGRDEEIQSLKKDRDEKGMKLESLSLEIEKSRKELTYREEELKAFQKNGVYQEKDFRAKTNSLSCEVEKLKVELAGRDEVIASLKKDGSGKDHQEKLEDLSRDVEKLRKELSCRDEENEALKLTVKNCKVELETKSTQLMSSKKVQGGRLATPTKTPTKTGANLVKQLEKRLQETTTALDRKNTQLISKNANIDKLEESLKNAKNDLEDQEKELSELRVANELLTREKNSVDEKKTGEVKENENLLKELEVLLAVKNKENEEVVGNLKFVEGELEIVENNSKEKEKQLVQMQEDCKMLQVEVETLKEQVRNANKEMSRLKDEQERSNQTKTNAEKELEEKEVFCKDAKTEMEEIQVSIESKERELHRREIKINSLTETIDGLTKELAHVQDNYKALQETNNQALSDLVNVQATVNVRNQELQQLEILDKSQKDAYREMQTDIMSVKRELEQARDELKLNENEKSRIKEEMQLQKEQEVLKVKEECECMTERMKIGLAEQDEVLSQMEKEMTKKEEEMGELQQEVEKLNKEMQERDGEVKKLGEDKKSLDDQHERLKITVFELKTEIEKLQKELKKERSKKGRDLTKALREGLEEAKEKKAKFEEMQDIVRKEGAAQKLAFEAKMKELEEQTIAFMQDKGFSMKADQSDERTTSDKDTTNSCPSDTNEDTDEYKPVAVESFDFPMRDRVEIDVTPITGSRVGKSGKKKTLKRKSSDLTLKEIKELNEKKKKPNNNNNQSDDDFTPVSVVKLRKTRSSSVNCPRPGHLTQSIVQSPSSFSLPVFDENSENVRPAQGYSPRAAKAHSGRRRFFSKLGIHESPKAKSEKVASSKSIAPPKRRKLLKKNQISAPLTDSPHSQSSDKQETPNTAQVSRAKDIITRHLRSRVVKSSQ